MASDSGLPANQTTEVAAATTVEFLPLSSDIESTQVAPGVYLPIPALLVVPDHPVLQFVTRIEIQFDGTRVYAEQVGVQSLHPTRPVTGAELRAVRVASLLSEYLPREAENSLGGKLLEGDTVEAAALRQGGICDPRTIEYVATTYQLARALGLPPAKYVQDRLGLTRPTATRWIRRARHAGRLDDAVLPREAVTDAE